MEEICLKPSASILLESMRAIGYSPQAAIADIVDNSITAGATTVEVLYPPDARYIAIIDNGHGMTSEELILAMKLGSKSANAPRHVSDLGRFGLGLKTAAFSMGRRLTVASRRDGEAKVSCFSWDLDLIYNKDEWLLNKLSPREIGKVPEIDRLPLKCGTLVLVENLDRLADQRNKAESFSAQMSAVSEHLALVMHRYLDGEGGVTLKLMMNNRPVLGVDPFLRSNKATQKLSPDTLKIGDEEIRLAAFILPHLSKLSNAELASVIGKDSIRRNQGLYVYRNRRLIVYGTWFGLFRQEELTKLTRVMVDVPNSLDHAWRLDIKKSKATPPDEVKDALRRVIPSFSEKSKRVHHYRGDRFINSPVVSLWNRIENRNEISYEINEKHPLLEAFLDLLSGDEHRHARRIFRALAQSFPGEAFYNDRAMERTKTSAVAYKEEAEDTYDNLLELATVLLQASAADSAHQASLIDRLEFFEPFSHNLDLTEKIKGALRATVRL